MKFIDNPLTRFIFFGNYFYGICAVALSVESQLQQRVPFTSWIYYVVIFSLTVVYYSIAYIADKNTASINPRTKWYAEHADEIQWSQRFFSTIAVTGILYFAVNNLEKTFEIPVFSCVLLASFPLAAVFYYGIKGIYTLRNIGLLKPFVIAWVWAGIVTFYPMIASRIEHNLPFSLELINFTLLFKNFLFMSVLCILFDIKDYETDTNNELKTFIVKLGLHRTIAYILFPLCVLGFGAFLIFGFTRHFSTEKILLNTIPFLLTMIVSYSMYNKKNIFYYLIVIDGMMLVKAVCGSVAMIYF